MFTSTTATLLQHFSPSSAGETSLSWLPFGVELVVSSGNSSAHAMGRVHIRIGTRRRIHSVPLATQQVETVFADLK